jgi:hypothetical protein
VKQFHGSKYSSEEEMIFLSIFLGIRVSDKKVQLEESLKKINAFEDYASKARTIKNKVTHLNRMLFLIIFKHFTLREN